MATRTMPLWNPRSLLAFDNLDGKVTGKDELRLPPGHSRCECSQSLFPRPNFATGCVTLRHILWHEYAPSGQIDL